jgi:hypothetical protein
LATDGEFLQRANEGNDENILPSEIHTFVISVSFCEISAPAAVIRENPKMTERTEMGNLQASC